MSAQPTVGYVTQCRLCGEPVTKPSPPLDIPLLGEPGARAEKLVGICLQHLMQKHEAEFKEGTALLTQFQVFSILAAFNFGDPSVPPRLELIRAAIFAQVRKYTMHDNMIDHLIATWGLDPEDAEKVKQGMRALRDACCELGEFAAKVPEPSRIVPT